MSEIIIDSSLEKYIWKNTKIRPGSVSKIWSISDFENGLSVDGHKKGNIEAIMRFMDGDFRYLDDGGYRPARIILDGDEGLRTGKIITENSIHRAILNPKDYLFQVAQFISLKRFSTKGFNVDDSYGPIILTEYPLDAPPKLINKIQNLAFRVFRKRALIIIAASDCPLSIIESSLDITFDYKLVCNRPRKTKFRTNISMSDLSKKGYLKSRKHKEV